MITIGNNGPELTQTNYWLTEHAAAGLCYLSGNADTWRLLVPPPALHLVVEMKTGHSVTIERSGAVATPAWDVIFEDGTETPFAVTVDARQVDRAMTAGSCRLTVWTELGKMLELPCEVRL